MVSIFNPFNPEFEVDTSIIVYLHVLRCKLGFQSKIKNRMANSVYPDETAHYEPSHLDLHCLHRYHRCHFVGHSE